MKKQFLSLFSLLLLVGCASGPPPITQQITNRWLPGKVVWHDLLVEDAERVIPFYTQLFGWSAETQGRFTRLFLGTQPIASIVVVPNPRETPVFGRWLPSFSVRNVDRAAQAILDRGGKILEKPRDLPRRGRFALVSDPQGAQLVLLHSKTGDPVDHLPGINDWLWDELWTQDAEKSLAFYEELAGYAVQKIRAGYWVLLQGDRWLAGVRVLRRKELESRWVPVVRVEDPKVMSERAVALGGKLLVGTDEPPSDGTVALIADPAGALLMLQRWQPVEEVR